VDTSTLTALPGADLVLKGLRDLEDGTESIEALLVWVGASNLRASGLAVPPDASSTRPEHRLYARLEEMFGLAATAGTTRSSGVSSVLNGLWHA
jgi:hypothetical protein